MRTWAMHEGTSTSAGHLVCDPLRAAGLMHAFTLKPPASLQAEPGAGPPEDVLRRAGLAGVALCRPVQVHGAVVARPAEEPGRTRPERADAVLVRGAGGAAIATADCVGAVLMDSRDGSFGVIHAGWRGTLAGAVPVAIRALAEEAGSEPRSMILAMGPSIGGCCYVVGADVESRFREAFPAGSGSGIFGTRGGAPTLDLAAANRALALKEGLLPGNIHACGICTACRQDICWSYRVQGPGAGRMWTIAGREGR